MGECGGCRKFRQLVKPGVEVKVVVRGKKVVIRKRKVGDAMPCIENCDKMTAEEKKMYNILRFQELKEVYEPREIDYSEDNARREAEWCWMRLS